jgi:hypothetical protein
MWREHTEYGPDPVGDEYDLGSDEHDLDPGGPGHDGGATHVTERRGGVQRRCGERRDRGPGLRHGARILADITEPTRRPRRRAGGGRTTPATTRSASVRTAPWTSPRTPVLRGILSDRKTTTPTRCRASATSAPRFDLLGGTASRHVASTPARREHAPCAGFDLLYPSEVVLDGNGDLYVSTDNAFCLVELTKTGHVVYLGDLRRGCGVPAALATGPPGSVFGD